MIHEFNIGDKIIYTRYFVQKSPFKIGTIKALKLHDVFLFNGLYVSYWDLKYPYSPLFCKLLNKSWNQNLKSY